MEQEKNSIEYLIEKTRQAELELGLSKVTVYGSQATYFNAIKNFLVANNDGMYSEEMMEKYREMLAEQLKSKKLRQQSYTNRLKIAERIEEIHKTNQLTWSCKLRGSRFVLTAEYERVLSNFIAHSHYHKNTRGDVIWIGRKYLAFLQLAGCDSIAKITPDMIMNFVIHCTEHLKSGSVKNIMCFVKQFHEYLEKSGLTTVAYKGVLEVSVIRRMKVQKAITTEELNAIFKVIDTNKRNGKRNYAIILLGAVLGLRAVDIANLKLRDVDWRKNEIKLLQQKTGRFVILPLPSEVSVAMKDYILNARPKNDETTVFLRLNAPFTKIADSRSIGNMFENYQRKAGVKRTPFDGKGFHAMRRRLGKEMVLEGVPIATIAEVLGHGNVESPKQYISLDSEHLRDCSLSFDGIEVIHE